MGRTSPGGTRNGTGDVTRLSRESGTRSGAVHGADAGSRMAGTRSLERAAPSRATDGRSQVARRAADESLRNRTLSQGRVGGREVAVRASERVSSRDVHVYDVGHHGNGHADFIGHYQGGWHPSQYHYDHYWWPHHYYHDVDVGFSFTYVHSYYAPAHVMVYDVVPVVPVIVEPAPAFSVSFSYYSAPAVVSFRSVRYVYPMATVAPVVVVYREYVAPPIMTPVLFTPVITTAVVSVPVFVPGVAPVYAPVYYYYPAYTVMSYPTYYVEPTPALVAEPVVVEAPSSSWSISSAFGFSHHGKEFNIGGSFSKERSEPTVVADPAGTVEQPASDDIAMTGPAAAVAPAQSADQATLESGLAAIRAGDMEQARRILTQVVVNDPSDGMARMLYTSTMLADGQYKDAAEGLRRALETWQDLQLKDYYLPSVYDDAQRFTQTMRDVREFLSDHPERVDAWLLVGFSYAFSGETEQAQTVIAEAQKTWPEDPSFATLLKIVQAG